MESVIERITVFTSLFYVISNTLFNEINNHNVHLIRMQNVVNTMADDAMATQVLNYVSLNIAVSAPEKFFSLQWRHNGRDGISNHQLHDCLLSRLFRSTPKKISKLSVTGLCAGNSLVTGEFPTEMASNAKMFPFDDVIMTYNM